MRAFIIIITAVALATAGAYLFVHVDHEWGESDMDYPVTLDITFDESKFDVSIDGKTIKSGDTFKFYEDKEVNIKSKIGRIMIQVDGEWGDKSAGGYTHEKYLGTSYDVQIINSAYYGEEKGYLTITQGSDE